MVRVNYRGYNDMELSFSCAGVDTRAMSSR